MKPLLVLALAVSRLAFAAPDCSCGPDYCVDTPEYRTDLAAKKAAAKESDAPARLIALYDKLDHCEASIGGSPDTFNILRHDSDGSIYVDNWTSENEKIDAAAVKAGTLKACYVILSRKAFACCKGVKAEDRPDYDRTLQMNTSLALPCQ